MINTYLYALLFILFSLVLILNARKKIKNYNRLIDVYTNNIKSKNDFLADMSHEIRTPVNTISAITDFILSENLSAFEIKEKAAYIKTACKSLIYLINGFLETTNEIYISEVPYNISVLLNELSEDISLKLHSKPIEFLTKFDIEAPELIGDKQKIKQILLNLLTNAIKYTKSGKITFSTEQNVIGELVILNFTVSDTGEGIKEKYLKEVFSQFTKIENGKNTDGAGLGLYISKKLLNSMGGTIRAESFYGKGSKFIVNIPQKKSNVKTGGLSQNKINIKNTNILISDPDYENLTVMSELFKLYGIAPDTSMSYNDTINSFENNKYDIIYICHKPPEMDAIEAASKIRQSDKEIPLISYSADASPSLKNELVKNGFDICLNKPILILEIENTLRMFIDEKNIITDKNTKNNTIENIDIEQGISFCGGNMQDYVEVLNIFYINGIAQINLMIDYQNKNNIEGFLTEIHSLKSAAKGIGAQVLSDSAHETELKTKDSTGPFFIEYKKTLENISEFLKQYTKKQNSKNISEGEIIKNLENVIAFCQNYQYTEALNILNELSLYNIDKNISAKIFNIKEQLSCFLYSEAIRLTTELIKEILL